MEIFCVMLHTGIVLLQTQVERHSLYMNLICYEANARIPPTDRVVAQCWICFVALAGGVGHRASWLACVWPGGGVDSSAQRGEPPPVGTHHRHHTVACCLDISLLCVVWTPQGPLHFSHYVFLFKIEVLVCDINWKSKLDIIHFLYLHLYLFLSSFVQ